MVNFFYIIMKYFYNNLDILSVIMYFCFLLIGLINDYKNIYSHNVCLGVCMMIFMRIVSMQCFL